MCNFTFPILSFFKDKIFYIFIFLSNICSASLKSYAHDDISVGSWMMGVQATFIDDNRLCCSSIRQGISCCSCILISIYFKVEFWQSFRIVVGRRAWHMGPHTFIIIGFDFNFNFFFILAKSCWLSYIWQLYLTLFPDKVCFLA